ncbi:hypothetical protein FH966_02410 [Lentibacillus cibarius]|uniref:SLH domain-containing protein n=1 Tax=Lentibacillus cibarius TaxID=2583219 RepID=A0A549YFK1_9BACI|nr:S-layer homology domain-containing protein [Lentibacillus cibarius]TRM10664.1 hypothetical protein FH966_02410 [Lentibacillus cibarius]
MPIPDSDVEVDFDKPKEDEDSDDGSKEPQLDLEYADLDLQAYWGKDMIWAVDRGLISGYKDVKNPITGEKENLLKPYGTLTEAQFLTILLNYTEPEEMDKKLKNSNHSYWAYPQYELALQYNLPTLASIGDWSSADKPITRGKMAQLLVSKYYGKVAPEKSAMDFFIENNITSKDDYQDFRPDDTLTRAHVVTFMKNYHDTLNK